MPSGQSLPKVLEPAGKKVQHANFNPHWAWGIDKNVDWLVSWLESRIGQKVVVTSGVRSPEHNKQVGGVSDSAHLVGLAVDLACSDDRLRWQLVAYAVLAGVRRIGIYEKHVHLDIDPKLPQKVLWMESKA